MLKKKADFSLRMAIWRVKLIRDLRDGQGKTATGR
jgi:hypothetical protein